MSVSGTKNSSGTCWGGAQGNDCNMSVWNRRSSANSAENSSSRRVTALSISEVIDIAWWDLFIPTKNKLNSSQNALNLPVIVLFKPSTTASLERLLTFSIYSASSLILYGVSFESRIWALKSDVWILFFFLPLFLVLSTFLDARNWPVWGKHTVVWKWNYKKFLLDVFTHIYVGHSLPDIWMIFDTILMEL